MTYQISTFSGDSEHTICCTGDAVVGDQVAFERATFSGSLRKPKFAGFEMVTGMIVADSYGPEKQQHTFTILRADGTKTLIKGRNLYAQTLMRRPWSDESKRRGAAEEKHGRGDSARSACAQRIENRACVGF